MGWIDVNDEIPDQGQLVIMYHPGRGVWIDRMWAVITTKNVLYHLCTHWMPVPEPPEQSSK